MMFMMLMVSSLMCTYSLHECTFLLSIVELLHSYTTVQSHWPSGSTISFPPRRAAVCALGVHLHYWNWDLLLAILATLVTQLDS